MYLDQRAAETGACDIYLNKVIDSFRQILPELANLSAAAYQNTLHYV